MHDANQQSGNGESDRQLPGELADVLRRLERPSLEIPRDVDDRIRKRAREILEAQGAANIVPLERPEAGNSRVWWRWGVGIAAGVLLLLALSRFEQENQPPAISLEQPTIRDAFLLAKRIEAGGRLDPVFDLNGDGEVTDADVDLLASRAVRLPEGESL